MAAVLECFKGAWIIGCDFNVTPVELEDNGWLVEPAPIEAGDRAIHYFAVAEWLVHVVYRIEDSGISPHAPVRIALRFEARHHMAR